MDVNNVKESNPKDAIGCTKPAMSVFPMGVLVRAGLETVHPRVRHMLALGMLEGACKYGRHNYRAVGVRASIYFDAFHRHMDAYRTGEFIDKESGLPHLIKAGTSLLVLLDAIGCCNWYDDRPPCYPFRNVFDRGTPEGAAWAWWEGEHTRMLHAALRLAVLEYSDNAPTPGAHWFAEIKEKCAEILARYPNPKAPFTQAEYPAK